MFMYVTVFNTEGYGQCKNGFRKDIVFVLQVTPFCLHMTYTASIRRKIAANMAVDYNSRFQRETLSEYTLTVSKS